MESVPTYLLQLALSKIQMLASCCGWLLLTSPLDTDHSRPYDWLVILFQGLMLYTCYAHLIPYHSRPIARTTSIRFCRPRQRTALLPILGARKSPIKIVVSSRHRLVVV